MDIVSRQQRSKMMSRIRGKGTKPEMVVRRMAHGLGYRFRLHRRDLPGSPDLVFPRLKLVIFVSGCFWHRHEDCRYAYMPKSNVDFWSRKFENNVIRDRKVMGELEGRGTALPAVCRGHPTTRHSRRRHRCIGHVRRTRSASTTSPFR